MKQSLAESAMELVLGLTALGIGAAADFGVRQAWHHHKDIVLGIAIPLACFTYYGVCLRLSPKTARSRWRRVIGKAALVTLAALVVVLLSVVLFAIDG
jgi:hypothetical protein